jgi:hypothetical protein
LDGLALAPDRFQELVHHHRRGTVSLRDLPGGARMPGRVLRHAKLAATLRQVIAITLPRRVERAHFDQAPAALQELFRGLVVGMEVGRDLQFLCRLEDEVCPSA